MFKLTKLHKAVTEALNAVPNVDDLAKSLGAVDVRPRVVSEHGGTHSATCIAYEPTQRLLAVGVDTGVKIIGGDGVEALLATPHHVEPARCVEFMPGVGRVMRVSVDNGIDVFDLDSQTCLASTRWPTDVTCACGMKDSPFVMVGQSTGDVAVAAVQHGADGDGILAPRSYSVARADAFNRNGKKGEGVARPGPCPAVVAVKPQPRRESTHVLIAYADGSMSLWDLHRRRPIATHPPIEFDESPPGESPPGLVGIVDDGGGACVQWVGGSGRTVAVAHADGSVATYDVPHASAIDDASALRNRQSIAAIVRTRVTFPSKGPPATTAGDETFVVEGFEPTRRICAVAAGGPFDGWRTDSRRLPTGAVLCVGGEGVGAAADPARIVTLGTTEGDGDGDEGVTGVTGVTGESFGFGTTSIPLPWFGPVLDAVLIRRAGSSDVVHSAAVLSEGGQIHVHDLRFMRAGTRTGERPGDAEADATAPNSEPPTEAPTAAAESLAPTEARFPCAEVLDPMPSLSATCDPACALASPRLLASLRSRVQTPAGTNTNTESVFSPTFTFQGAVDRAAWGAEWPVSGARVDEKSVKWASRREKLRHVLAIPSGEKSGNVRVFSDGDPFPGKLTELPGAYPGPNAGTTTADRVVTRCHVALGGLLLVLGRACGAVEVHAAALKDRGDGSRGSARGTIRQLDSGLDLASAGGGTDTNRHEGGGYELVAELGAHASPITSIVTDANCALLAVGDVKGVVTLVDLAEGLMMTSSRVFSRDGEGVGCMELCPRIVGTETGSGSNGGGDADVTGSNPGGDDASGSTFEGGCDGDEAGDDDTAGDRGATAAVPASRFPGAEVLCVASTESAVAFLDVARGTGLNLGGASAHKTRLTPKTPSAALAVAPLTMNGTPPRSITAFGRGADGALHASTTASSLWFNSRSYPGSTTGEDEPAPARTSSTTGEDEPAPARTSSTGGKINRRASWACAAAANEATAFVAVASAEAIRVYPAHGAARGERHTVKKASTEEPLVAAALVAPISPDDDDDDDDDRYDDRYDDDDGLVSGTPHARVRFRSIPSAFAAVSTRGRLLSWSLPGLVPLRSVGPVPPLSVADGAGFCVDGVLFASVGGGAGTVAKLSLAPRRSGGVKGQRAESGLALFDGELAAAALAAESAGRLFDTQRHPKVGTGGHPSAPSTQSPFSPEGTPEKAFGGPDKPKNAASSQKSDLTKSMNSFLKGDSRAALASFGSVMRATKDKANAAMAQAKVRIKERMGAAGPGDDTDGDFPTDDKTAADLAFLFADRELHLTEEPATRGRAVSSAGAGRRGAGSSSTGAAEDSDRAALFGSGGSAAGAASAGVGSSRMAQSGSNGDDADRAALFGTVGSGGSATSHPVAPKVNTAADIRAKYGIRKKGSGSEGRGGSSRDGDASLGAALEETRDKLHERGERLRGIQDTTERMRSDAEDFASMAEKLRKRQEKSWW